MAKTDVWMPLYIGDYLADTMHLSAAAHGAYLLLLMHQWKSGRIQNRSVLQITRMTAEQWSEVSEDVLAYFETDNQGLLFHKRIEQERDRTESIAQRNRENGQKGGRPKTQTKPSEEPKQNPNLTKSQSQLHKDKIPSRKRAAKDEPDPRHKTFKELLGKAYAHKNPGVDMPWDASEASHLASILQALPNMGEQTFKTFLNNWHKSEVNHAERPRVWLARITDYANGPIDRYGKPMVPPTEAKAPPTIAEKLGRTA